MGALGFVLLLSESPSIKHRIDLSNNLKQKINTSNYEAIILKVRKDDAAKKSVIAEERYTKGCSIPVLKEDRNQYVSIYPGMTVEGTSGHPLAPNTPVCDKDGNTGVMTLSGDRTVVAEIAYTGNWNVINHTRKYHVVAYATSTSTSIKNKKN